MRHFTFGLALTGVLSLNAAQNLILNGDFADEGKFAKECVTDGGKTSKLTLFSEDLTWNKCAKLEIVNVQKSDKDTDVINANAWIGCNAEGKLPGFNVRPNTTYQFTIDLRGTPKYARVGARTWATDDLWKETAFRLTTVSFTKITNEWQTFRGTFKTGPKDKRAALGVQLWSDTQYPKAYQYKKGDWVLIDNVSVYDRQGDIEAFAKNYGKSFSVAPVSISSDMAIPFLPEEIMTPPTAIRVKMAINEIRSVPVAIANLTGEMQEYRVSLEQKTPPDGYTPRDGFFGLSGFPENQITVRRAVRAKDNDQYPDKLRLDALVKVDEASTLPIPAKEAGLMTFDFDTAGVAPGTYRGILRVIPLSEPAEFEQKGANYSDIHYKGPMRDIPFEVEVQPIMLDREPVVPGGFYGLAADRRMFHEMVTMGAREFMISPWAFVFGRTADGGFDIEDWHIPAWNGADVDNVIRRHREWASEEGVNIRFLIAYSSFHTFGKLYPKITDKEELFRAWPKWITAIRQFMEKQGLTTADWSIETFDEPPATDFEMVLRALRTAHAAEPTVDQLITFLGGNSPMSIDQLKKLEPYVKSYIFHDFKHLRDKGYHAYIAHLRASGKSISHYTCSTRPNEDIDHEYRQNAWMGERHNLTGNAMYQLVDQHGGCGAKNWKVVNRGALLYRASGNTIHSTRSLAIRQGVEDVKYLRELKKYAKGDRAAEAFLATAAQRVTDNPAGGDRYLADRVREEAAAHIIRLQRPLLAAEDPVIGNWSARLPYGQMFAGSIILGRDAKGEANGTMLWRWASPEDISNLSIHGNTFSFKHPNGLTFMGVVMGDRMSARVARIDADSGELIDPWKSFIGWRNAPIDPAVRTEQAKLGEPIDLLKDGLDGWKTMNPKAKFGWSFKDGVLSNALGHNKYGGWAGGGANLMSKRADFFDFNLEYDVRVPTNSNSGVYLRGRFECQVVDSFQKPVDCHNMAAYYGRVAPSVAVEKAPGEWQHVSVTLYKGHITTYLNGVKIIDNAELVGVTGGAIDASLTAPGPIYLQGDHSDADYKNMILRPAL